MRVVVVGSCLSASIATSLAKNEGATVTASLHHVRSDLLKAYFVDRAYEPPDDATIAEIIQRFGEPSLRRRNRKRAESQTARSFAALEEAIAAADVLVVDNHYELTFRGWKVVLGDRTYHLSLTLGAAAESFGTTGRLAASASIANLQSVFSRFRAVNPSLTIVLVAYPYAHLDPTLDGARLERAREYGSRAVMSDDVVFVPPVRIPPSGTSAEGGLYFQDSVYDAYARFVARAARSGAVGPRLGGNPTLEDLDSEQPAPLRERDSAAHAPGKNPYVGLPARSYWKTGVATKSFLDLDDLYRAKFQVRREDRLATFGSCFAQHIGRRFKEGGFRFMDAEPAPPSLPSQEHTRWGYGLYSARYGNVYTARQMRQLFERAFGRFTPTRHVLGTGPYYDAFRPNLQPEGYSTIEALRTDVAEHLRRVRQVFLDADVIALTLGLTEAWKSASEGSVYPVCPGTTHGVFDPVEHVFHNFDYPETREDLEWLLREVRAVNPRARWILTVSPVPLTATATDAHVLSASVYSKSVLRAVAGDLASAHDFVDYFPSFEIIQSHPARAMFFEPNLRSVSPKGVAHVMSYFFREHGGGDEHAARGDEDELCDEALLELSRLKSG